MSRLISSLTSDRTMLTACILGYGGALPFLGCAIAANQQITILGLPPSYLLLSYGAIILSFLGGLHWGRVITRPSQADLSGYTWLIWSVSPSLLGWAGLLLPIKVGAVLLSLCFLVTLFVDRKLVLEKTWPSWMQPLRLHLSIIATSSLISLLFLK